MKTIFKKFLGLVFITIFFLLLQKNRSFHIYEYFDVSEGPEVAWLQNLKSLRNNMSNVGRHVFLNELLGISDPKKSFRISVWKHGPSLEFRFLKKHGAVKNDPLLNCPVQNCYVTYDSDNVTGADAVFFHLQETMGPHTLPKSRTPNQRWIFYTEESPHHTFLLTKEYILKDYNGIFNWSMTYRTDSDIPAAYARTVPLVTPLNEPVLYNKTKLLAQMNSNCGGANNRMAYIRNMSHYITIDIYGLCGPFKCHDSQVHFYSDCTNINDYKFYLAFENSNCREYITEKVWWQAFHKGAVPVVYGGPKKYYELLCPPNSFIHVDDFNSPQDLANYLLYLDANPEEYNKYREWTKYFEVRNEHGYHGSEIYYYCRICEALNFNDPSPKVYNELEKFWNTSLDCIKRDLK